MGSSLREKLYIFANYIIVAMGFVLPFNHRATTVLAAILLILAIATKDYKKKFNLIVSNRAILMFLIYILLFYAGILWSENIRGGVRISERVLLFLVAPVVFTMAKKEYLKYALYALLSSLAITSVLIILIKYNLIPMSYTDNKAPFMHKNTIAFMLVFATSYYLYKINFKNLILLPILFVDIYALLITKSRTGLVLFLFVVLVILIKRYGLSLYKFLSITAATAILFIAIYTLNKPIQNRINQTIEVMQKLDLKKQIEDKKHPGRTALSCRFEFWNYAYEIGKTSPIIGIGTGDSIIELNKLIGEKESKKLFNDCLGNGSGQFNPHNVIMFMWMQFGILGVFVLFYMFYTQFKEALKSEYILLILLVAISFIHIQTDVVIFTTRFFILFYGYTFSIVYLLSKSSDKDKI